MFVLLSEVEGLYMINNTVLYYPALLYNVDMFSRSIHYPLLLKYQNNSNEN